ncbi:MAG: hypothetical protein IJO65_00385 [Lachnospiraceae bacterium]|nr:hypothetical protein [Lachnospiraceae bacterium]
MMSDFTVYIQADLRYGKFLLEKVGVKKVIEKTLQSARELDADNVICGVYDTIENLPLIEILKDNDVEVILSDEENVTKRMLESLQKVKAGSIVRIAGDQCLLDVSLTRKVMSEYQRQKMQFFREESPSNSVLPDIVSVDVLHKYQNEIIEKYRYWDALTDKDDVKRLRMPLPTLMFNFKAHCYDSYRTCNKIVESNLDIYDLNVKCLNWMNALNSDLRKRGVLSSWVLPYWDNFFEDDEGKNNPWWTVAAVDFLTPRLTKEMKVFEWGCGNSSLYFAQYVSEVTSVENDFEWYEKMRDICPSNVKLSLHENVENRDYCDAILSCKQKFDIILVDGEDRNNCTRNAVEMLNAEGVIIIDNANCDYTEGGRKYLNEKGFRCLEFDGVLYGCSGTKNITAIFYRDGNCLNI